jgi:hypothetical protein
MGNSGSMGKDMENNPSSGMSRGSGSTNKGEIGSTGDVGSSSSGRH